MARVNVRLVRYTVTTMTPTAQSISAFYDARKESERLGCGIGRLEAVRTLELLGRYLPSAPAVVCDVGGGTGYYARWLTGRGYAVHLIDVVGEHVNVARA